MFGFGSKRDVSAPVLTLDLHTTSPGEPPSAIKRNHIKRKKAGGMNIYHRADKIFLRSRVIEGGRTLAELY
jgi:hypothetical protein